MPSRKNGSLKQIGGGLGAAIRNDKWQKVEARLPKNFGATDCPKNAHLIPEWENLEEEQELLRRANATSVIDEGDLAALMRVAELSNRDFAATRQSTRVVMGGPVIVEDQAAKEELPAHLKNLPIPKRPPWDKKMSKEHVDFSEREAFLAWRRGFVEMEENYDIALTPFEKNIEFWRQLWRVVEKSDVVVQVVDARNPLLYRSESLREYVTEVGAHKINVILFNKADLLPKKVREAWGKYLDAQNVRCFFFAARTEIEARLKEEMIEKRKKKEEKIDEGNEDEEDLHDDEGDADMVHAAAERLDETIDAHPPQQDAKPTTTMDGEEVRVDAMGRVIFEDEDEAADSVDDDATVGGMDENGRKRNTTAVLSASDLLDELEALGWEAVRNSGRKVMQDVRDPENRSVSSLAGVSTASSRHQTDYIMIGFVGYPNVGKSSTINALLGQKKVGVTSTPGKTKHFQTMIVSDSLQLCDCPGLVFPSVVASRAEMVVGGILPLHALKDHISPMELLAKRIPRAIFEETYNIVLPSRTQKGEERVYVTWQEVCTGYAVSRSLLTGCRGGVPDTHTAARQLIKDYVDGKLRFCHLPPEDGVQGDKGTCPGVNSAMLSSASQSALAASHMPALGGRLSSVVSTSSVGSKVGGSLSELGLEASDAAVGAGDKDVRLAVQGARDKIVFQMDSAASAEPGVAVGQTHSGRKGREHRGLSAGVWADEDEATLLKKEKEVAVKLSKGGKKHGGGSFAGRVERPYSLLPVRDAQGRPMSREAQMQLLRPSSAASSRTTSAA